MAITVFWYAWMPHSWLINGQYCLFCRHTGEPPSRVCRKHNRFERIQMCVCVGKKREEHAYNITLSIWCDFHRLTFRKQYIEMWSRCGANGYAKTNRSRVWESHVVLPRLPPPCPPVAISLGKRSPSCKALVDFSGFEGIHGVLPGELFIDDVPNLESLVGKLFWNSTTIGKTKNTFTDEHTRCVISSLMGRGLGFGRRSINQAIN